MPLQSWKAAITSRDDMKKLIEIQKNEVNEKIAQEFKMIFGLEFSITGIS